MSAPAYTTAKPVVVSLAELEDGTFFPNRCVCRMVRTLTHRGAGSVASSTLLEAFGPDSLGIIVVTALPARFAELRTRLLSYASHIASLPASTLRALESPGSNYLVGWSCGRETLSADGRADTLKGSYYVNCAYYTSPTLDGAAGADRYPDFPEYTAGNIWPPLDGFEDTCKELCALVIDAAALVARACDRYAADNVAGYTEGYLEHVVKTSTTTKARLLHYFPPPPRGTEEEGEVGEEEQDLDSWCGTHLDHGCLTGLTSAMYVDEAASPPDISRAVELEELAGPPDPEAGLYIRDRKGRVVKAAIPRDALAFQTGEALEKITRGRFKAVPHFVRGMRAGRGGGRVARNTLAVFTREFILSFHLISFPFSPPYWVSDARWLTWRTTSRQSRICGRWLTTRRILRGSQR